MRCEDVREIISLYIDNELNGEERNEIIEHLQSCEECNREYEDLLTIKRLLSETPEIELPSNFKEELHKKLVESVLQEENKANENNDVIDFGKRVNKKRLNWKVLSGVAAALFLTVVSISAIMDNNFSVGDKAEMHMQESAPEQDISLKMAEDNRSYSSELAKEAPMQANEEGMDNYSIEAPDESAPQMARNQNEAATIRGMYKKIILIEQMIIQVEDYDWTFGSIEKLISSKGGYLQSSNISEQKIDEGTSEESLKTGNLVFRVSNNEFDNVIGELAQMGSIINEVTTSNDVTNEYNEASTLLMNLELEEIAISEAIKAGEAKYGEIDSEKALAEVRSEIAKLKANISRWDDLVGLATIHIKLEEVVLEGSD